MPDYGRPIEFGLSLVPTAADWPNSMAAIQEADRLGLEWVGIQDHPYQRRFHETMTLLASLATTTRSIGFFPDVANLPLRPPAMLAKQAASLDVLSGGRFELGLGAGAFWDAIAAMGGPRRSPGEALAALDEAIRVMRLIWSGARGLRFDGVHYQLSGVHSGPVPPHRIGIWLGVLGPRALRLLGRAADGWVPSLPRLTMAELADKHEQIDEAAIEAGRDPAEIRRLANVNGTITSGDSHGRLQGPPNQWIEELADLALNHGIDTFIVWPEGDVMDQTRQLAELVSDVRDLVERERKEGPR